MCFIWNTHRGQIINKRPWRRGGFNEEKTDYPVLEGIAKQAGLNELKNGRAWERRNYIEG